MEYISTDVFPGILSYLSNESIINLRTNVNIDKAITKTVNTNNFWKQRIETRPNG